MNSFEKIPCKVVFYDGKTNLLRKVEKSVPLKVWKAFKDKITRTLINRIWDSNQGTKHIEYCKS